MCLRTDAEPLVPHDLTDELVTYLQHARDLERLDLRLLRRGASSAQDDQVREVYRSHGAQTEEHLQLIEKRLEAHSGDGEHDPDRGFVGALEIRYGEATAPTPTQLALSAYAFESLEIAVYHLLVRVAERCQEEETASVIGKILEEEEQAAERLASTFDRALAVTLNG